MLPASSFEKIYIYMLRSVVFCDIIIKNWEDF